MTSLSWNKTAPSHSAHLLNMPDGDDDTDDESRPLIGDVEHQESGMEVLRSSTTPVTPGDGQRDGGSEESTLLEGPQRQKRRRRASPAWLVFVIFMTNLTKGGITAPKVEVFTILACRAVVPDAPMLWDWAMSGSSLPPECRKNVDVQREAARLQATVNTLLAVVTSLVAGRWGRFSDDHGRNRVIWLTVFGGFITDILFLFASLKSVGVHGKWLLLATPFIEGVLGGIPTFSGTTHAYISDCTTMGNRASTFAWLQGVQYVGLASGPYLAGAVLHLVGSTNVTIIFIVNFVCFVINLIYIYFFLPESVSHEQIRSSHSRRHSRSRKKSVSVSIHTTSSSGHASAFADGHAQEPSTSSTRTKEILHKSRENIMKFLLPLALFLPSRPPSLGSPRNGHGRVSARSNRRMWTLTIFAIGFFLYELTLGLAAVKYLYTKLTFGWGAEELGYYVSFYWTIRAIYLLLIMPYLVNYFKPTALKEAFAQSRSSSHVSVASNSGVPPSPEILVAQTKYDLLVAITSYCFDIVSNCLIAIGPAASWPFFVFATALGCVTSGALPVLYSFSAGLLQCKTGSTREVGQLYGAMSVVSAISHAIQPSLYAYLYSRTVATHPRAIFVSTACLTTSAVIFFSFIRPKITYGASLSRSGSISTVTDSTTALNADAENPNPISPIAAPAPPKVGSDGREPVRAG